MAPHLRAVPSGPLSADWGRWGPGGLISIVVAASQEDAVAYHVVLIRGVHLFVICPQLTSLIKVTQHWEQFLPTNLMKHFLGKCNFVKLIQK